MKISNREGDVFFGVTCNTVDRFVFYLSKTLHDEMGVIAAEVVHDDRYRCLSVRAFVVFVQQIALVVGGSRTYDCGFWSVMKEICPSL